MPPVLDAAPAGAELLSALSTMTTAVVRNSAAKEAAFGLRRVLVVLVELTRTRAVTRCTVSAAAREQLLIALGSA
jgi:hypothetical protein